MKRRTEWEVESTRFVVWALLATLYLIWGAYRLVLSIHVYQQTCQQLCHILGLVLLERRNLRTGLDIVSNKDCIASLLVQDCPSQFIYQNAIFVCVLMGAIL